MILINGSWKVLKGLVKRMWCRFVPRVVFLPRQYTPTRRLSRVEVGERVYYLRLQVVEHNGDFIKEVTFRNCWNTPEEAEGWMNGLVLLARDLMRNHGSELEVESQTKVTE